MRIVRIVHLRMKKALKQSKQVLSDWQIIFTVPADIEMPLRTFKRTFVDGRQSTAVAALVRIGLFVLGYTEADEAIMNLLRPRLLSLGWKEPGTCEAEYEQAA